MKNTYLGLIMVFAMIGCNESKVDNPEKNNELPTKMNNIIGYGRIYPLNDIVQLASPVNGIIEKNYKKENDSVQQGEIIIELEHSIETANVLRIENKLKMEKAHYESEKASLKECQIRFDNKKKSKERIESLLLLKAETQQNYDDSKAEVESLKATIDKLYSNVTAGEYSIAEIECELAVAKSGLIQKFIKAPCDGVILQMNAPNGSSILALQTILQFVPEGPSIIECEVDELFANRVESGQNAIIRDLVTKDTLTSGKIYFASKDLQKKSMFSGNTGDMEDRRVRKIKIKPNESAPLLINCRVECVIILETNK